MDYIRDLTKDNDGGVFNICLNYGGRAEIVDMVKNISKDTVAHDIDIEDIDEAYISANLYQNLPDIDFMIRTSGEERLSNFMLWQVSYAEFYFPKTYFPDFDEAEFEQALLVYNGRNRRFGGIQI